MPSSYISRASRSRRTVVGSVLVGGLILAGCGSGGQHDNGAPVAVGSTRAATGAYDGDQLDQPLVLTAADLSAPFRSSAGGSTTLAKLGQGKLMLLYFGYTHCPDVCPTTMADLGLALKQVPTQLRFHTQVVFVTSDPDRDTPAVMKAWLGNFDSGLPVPFVGLTASLTQIDKIATSVGVPLSPPVKNPDGSITVQHGAQTMAFQDGKAHVLWLAGTSVASYAHDIDKLLEGSGS